MFGQGVPRDQLTGPESRCMGMSRVSLAGRGISKGKGKEAETFSVGL
jgi:hypothetical protein